MRPLLVLIAAVACAAALTVTAAGRQTDSREPQGSSVGNGDGPAPSIAPAVRATARRAGCRLRTFASDGFQHGLSFSYKQIPPTSGTHASRWAEWGL